MAAPTAARSPQFRADLCTRCGSCFQRCPVMNLPVEVAQAEINRLIKGEKTEYVLSNCTTCLGCNAYCPVDAHPYQLILERWNDRYLQEGAPPLYRFVCPTEQGNMWQLLNIFLSPTEREWVSQWMEKVPQPGDKILLVGNYTHLFPFILGDSALLAHFTPIDRIDQWEGGAYLYQGGYLDVVQAIGRRAKADFDGWGVSEVVTLLDAVSYIFTEVHPAEMGTPLAQHFTRFNSWLYNQVAEHKIALPHPLNIAVTVHDNCYSKALGEEAWGPPREILKMCGCTVHEMAHIKADSLCCGFGAGASWVKKLAIPFDMISEAAKKFQEAEASGADALVSYCGGCIYLLWATKELLGSPLDVYHIVEVVRLAMGEELGYPGLHRRRAWDIIAVITYSLIKSLFRKNFYINEITYDTDMSTFRPHKYPLLRLIRWAFRSRLIQKVYAKLFRALLPRVRTRQF